MLSFITKPGRWFVNRKNYKTFSDFDISEKSLSKLCDIDKAIILDEAKRTDIKAFSFVMWLMFAVIVVAGIIVIVRLM